MLDVPADLLALAPTTGRPDGGTEAREES